MNHISNNSQTNRVMGFRHHRLLSYTLSLISYFLITLPFPAAAQQAVDEVTKPKQAQTPPVREEVRDNFNATLTDITGDILVFQGKKYVPATENMRLKNGDRIMAMRNSSAEIHYDNRCKQVVTATSISDVDSAQNSLDCPIVELTKQPVPAAVPPAPVTPPLPVTNPGFIATIVGPPIIILTKDEDDDKRAVSP